MYAYMLDHSIRRNLEACSGVNLPDLTSEVKVDRCRSCRELLSDRNALHNFVPFYNSNLHDLQ